MPSYSIHVTAQTVDDHDPDALLEVVERLAAALRPALPYGTAIEGVHVNRDKPATDDTDRSLFVEAGDTLQIADNAAHRTVRVIAVDEATDEQPARLTVREYGTTMQDALKARMNAGGVR
ncbi:hypothetical protein GCM10023224_05300 [Streptomonospora halophila]|uniref:Uncharacterized protein n=1 Tax=Streptomonospora halophila TaxID=427369 RepID=A0ABP9G5K6_9ACTN